ncbi:MAG TPA: hypothetical protein VKZ53_27120 [Candidatus Angelobacter sp.]|nr:hypothetical protein [Candidatus Angelobacter sp.]
MPVEAPVAPAATAAVGSSSDASSSSVSSISSVSSVSSVSSASSGASTPSNGASSSAATAPETGSPEFFTEALRSAASEAERAGETEAGLLPGGGAASGDAAESAASSVASVSSDSVAEGEANGSAEARAAKQTGAAEEAENAREAQPPKEGDDRRSATLPNQTEIDLGESVSPQGLLEALGKAPDAVRQWWDDPANPLKETLTAMARRAAVADPILREIPDAETAREVVQTSANFHRFDDRFHQVGNVETAQKFWESLWNDFALRDGQGNVTGAHPAFAQLERAIFDANANALAKAAKESGFLHPSLENLVHDGLDAVYAQAKRDPQGENAHLIAAIDTLRELRPRPSLQGPELTDAQKAAQAKIDWERAQLDAERAEGQRQRAASALDTLDREVTDSLVDQFVPVLDKAGLSEFEYDNAVAAIDQALKAELQKNPLYAQRRAQLVQAILRSPSKETLAALKKHELTYANMKIGRITKEVLARATAGTLKRQAERQELRERQLERSRTEPRGTSTAWAPSLGGQGKSMADWQAEWEKLPGNAGSRMDPDWYFQRLMNQKR